MIYLRDHFKVLAGGNYNTAAIFLIPSKRLMKDLSRLAVNISY